MLKVIMLPGTVDLANKLLLIAAILQLEHDPPALGKEGSCSRKTKLEDVPIDWGLMSPDIVRYTIPEEALFAEVTMGKTALLPKTIGLIFWILNKQRDTFHRRSKSIEGYRFLPVLGRWWSIEDWLESLEEIN